jgi:hypothetical protein
MNWREKAGYLAKRADQKGGVWLMWLGAVADSPSRLGSTTDPEDLRDPANIELGYYEPGATREQILADVAKALGHPPTGEIDLGRPGRTPGPKGPREGKPEAKGPPTSPGPAEPVVAHESGGDETQAESPVAGETQQEPSVAEQTESEEGDSQALAVEEAGLQLPEGVTSRETNHARAILYQEWVRQHQQGATKHRALYGWLIQVLDDAEGQ